MRIINYAFDVINYLDKIIFELQENLSRINLKEIDTIIENILNANHIFLAGAGRSGLVIQLFANRLLHLGFSVSVVGEISAPHSKPGDLLIICSGSGETSYLKVLLDKAKKNEVNVALITANENSMLSKMSDSMLVLPGDLKDEKKHQSTVFSQPMGSNFEQLSCLTFDSLVLILMEKLNETSESMYLRHADFE